LKSEDLKDIVKQVYAARVKGGFDASEDEDDESGHGEEHEGCDCGEKHEACDCESHESCGCGDDACECGDHEPEDPEMWSLKVGYTEADLAAVPEGCNLGLGCGNPVALASLKEGEVVLDLGCGGGFDAFLAANQVGKKGHVIGVDMTPEMVEAAEASAKAGKYKNVEFKVGDIEKLPVEDGAVDVIISNCSINLAPDKQKVFKEAFRALKVGGRLLVADIVLLEKLPAEIQNSLEAYVGCIAGAALKDDYLKMIQDAGFMGVKVMNDAELKQAKEEDSPIFSIKVQAFKK
jgi:SAM-dependent methyltransferase